MSARRSTALPLRLLGRHVGGRADDHAHLRSAPGAVSVGEFVASAVADGARGSQRLGETEVEHLHRAVGADLDVRRLEIAMDDALLVRRLERVGDLPRDRQRLGERNRRRAR